MESVKKNKKALLGGIFVSIIIGVFLLILYLKVYSRKDTEDFKRILILGLDNAGKSTLLYKLKLGEIITTIPTIGFNIETVQTGGYTLTSWDLGGHDKLRPSWDKYFKTAKALVFVLDSKDSLRLPEAKKELNWLRKHELLKNLKLLVLANKQDLPGAMTEKQVWEELELRQVKNQSVLVQPTAVLTGQGLTEAFAWLDISINVV